MQQTGAAPAAEAGTRNHNDHDSDSIHSRSNSPTTPLVTSATAAAAAERQRRQHEDQQTAAGQAFLRAPDASAYHSLRIATSPGAMPLTSPMSAPMAMMVPHSAGGTMHHQHGGVAMLPFRAPPAALHVRPPPHGAVHSPPHTDPTGLPQLHPMRAHSMPQLHIDVYSPSSIAHFGGDDEVHTPHGASPDPAEGLILARPVPPAIDPTSRTQWRRRAHIFIESKPVHITILALVILDIVVVITEIFIGLFAYQQCLDYEGPEYPYHEKHWIHNTEEALRWTSVAILTIFVVETVLKLLVLGWRYYAHHPLHMFDAFVIFVSFFTSLFLPGGGAIEEIVGLSILLRLWRVFRIIDGVAIALHSQHAAYRHKLKAENKDLREQIAALQCQLLIQCSHVRHQIDGEHGGEHADCGHKHDHVPECGQGQGHETDVEMHELHGDADRNGTTDHATEGLRRTPPHQHQHQHQHPRPQSNYKKPEPSYSKDV